MSVNSYQTCEEHNSFEMVEASQLPPTEFTPGYSSLGGAIIGISSIFYLATTGRRTGLSSIFSGLFLPQKYEAYKTTFVGAFTITGLIFGMAWPLCTKNVKFALSNGNTPEEFAPSWLAVVLGGLLVGWGTRQGNGCTSGHGICGLARLSKRGFVAVCSFMATGILTSSLLSSFVPSLIVGENSKLSSPLVQKITKESWNTLFEKDTFPLFLWPLAVLLFGLVTLLWDIKEKLLSKNEHMATVISGVLFSCGLMISGMTNVWKVKNFLWFAPKHWDPSLIFVMGVGVGLALLPTWWLLVKSKWQKAMYTDAKIDTGKTLLATSVEETINKELLVGAATFGVGWGLSGLCPGPAFLAAVNGVPKVILGYIPAFILGSLLYGQYSERSKNKINTVEEEKPLSENTNSDSKDAKTIN